MRDICLGIRTVLVLPVAKKLAPPPPTSTAPAVTRRKAHWLCRKDEVEWLSIRCWKTLFWLLMSSSVLEIITGRDLIECSKLKCFAKRMLDMVPGGSGQWDRRSVLAPAAVRHRRCTCDVESELGRENMPNMTNKNSKEEEKAILNTCTLIQIHERVTVPNWVRACMYLRSCSVCFV